MFFIISKLITFFIYPLSLCLFLGFFLSIWVKGIKNKILLLIPITLLTIFSSFPTSQFLIESLEKNFPPVPINEVPDSDVVVVLGGMINSMSFHSEKPELNGGADRLTDAVILYKEKKCKKILFTGGSGLLMNPEAEEASHAKKIMLLLGVPSEDILIENQSRNTEENARYSQKILEEQNLKKVILVTSAFHMKRSVGIFKRKGIDIFPYPTDYRLLKREIIWDVLVPSSYFLDNSTISIKEWIGILAYKFKGYI